jgi:hypothetical protein
MCTLRWRCGGGMGLDDVREHLLPAGRERISWAKMAAVLVATRFCEPSSELHIAENWYRRTALCCSLAMRRPTRIGCIVRLIIWSRTRSTSKRICRSAAESCSRSRTKCCFTILPAPISRVKRKRKRVLSGWSVSPYRPGCLDRSMMCYSPMSELHSNVGVPPDLPGGSRSLTHAAVVDPTCVEATWTTWTQGLGNRIGAHTWTFTAFSGVPRLREILDLGRPEEIKLIFNRRIPCRLAKHDSGFAPASLQRREPLGRAHVVGEFLRRAIRLCFGFWRSMVPRTKSSGPTPS